MFTGIVEQIGSVLEVAEQTEGLRLVLSGQGLVELPVGASIAVNGVCLTAVKVEGERVTVEVIPETLNRTNLSEVGPGGSVNLERPMRADGRFDGHIVQGHVDGVGVVSAISHDDGGTMMTIEAPAALMSFIVEKGSITVDGVSLTVAAMTEGSFSVALIPQTLDFTTLGLRKPGDTVNLENDVIAKYVERLLEARE
ncbi:MAG: riboflavin synthase [Actinobacteria bacterium]|nr:riboflavin synthase [Actinomycetota bacterium]